MLRILSADDVARALPMREAIDGMREAFVQLSLGRAEVPLRGRLPVPAQDAVVLTMPASLPAGGDLAVKIVSVFPRNAARGEPLIHAVVLALDGETGRPTALLDGAALTALRTGAAGGLSAELLARPDAQTLAVLGSGVQARSGIAAVCAVRPIREVRVFSLNAEQAAQLAQELAGRAPIPPQIAVVGSAAEAVRGADIVYTATTSATPTFAGRDLKPGAHVIGIGSYTPQMQEVDVETVQRSLVVVDARESALAEAGDLIIPLQAGLIGPEHIHAEIGELAAGRKAGRTSAEQITFFKSCGVAVQDAVAARIALRNAERAGLGTVVAL